MQECEVGKSSLKANYGFAGNLVFLRVPDQHKASDHDAISLINIQIPIKRKSDQITVPPQPLFVKVRQGFFTLENGCQRYSNMFNNKTEP